jgi:hypothetical protein
MGAEHVDRAEARAKPDHQKDRNPAVHASVTPLVNLFSRADRKKRVRRT